MGDHVRLVAAPRDRDLDGPLDVVPVPVVALAVCQLGFHEMRRTLRSYSLERLERRAEILQATGWSPIGRVYRYPGLFQWRWGYALDLTKPRLVVRIWRGLIDRLTPTRTWV